ncbi:MAG: hypothetical protein GF329_19445 [Candidatus Lokiarchaeota archaeon]|nr:hypothetical protein [Candidatus Lokiarchaeota archaeon]
MIKIPLTPRQITLSIAFPIVAIAFIILGILILKKDKNYWGNRFFAMFFWIIAIALLFNLSYLFSTNYNFILIMNIATIEFINIGVISLLLGTFVIYKGTRIVNNYKTYLVIILNAVLIIMHLLISVNNAVSINNDPFWSLEFGIYELIFSQVLLGIIIITSLRIYLDITKEMKNKFRWYLLGLIFLDSTLVSIIIDNLNLFYWWGSIGAVLNFMVVIGALLIYIGIIRR